MNSEHPNVSDEQMAREAKAGSLEAFEQLVSRYEARVYAFISQFCLNQADVRELTQDTFVKAFQSIARFDERRALAPWLFTIARRKCIDRHRIAPPVAETPVPELVDEADPCELAARREEGENIWRWARERLGKTQYEALWLYYAEQMDVAEIAQVLGKTRVHVKVLLFRARQILARAIGAKNGGVVALKTHAQNAGSQVKRRDRIISQFASVAPPE